MALAIAGHPLTTPQSGTNGNLNTAGIFVSKVESTCQQLATFQVKGSKQVNH